MMKGTDGLPLIFRVICLTPGILECFVVVDFSLAKIQVFSVMLFFIIRLATRNLNPPNSPEQLSTYGNVITMSLIELSSSSFYTRGIPPIN